MKTGAVGVHDETTGELLHRYTTVHEPGGVLPIACKTRRASQCPPCAEVYRADTYQLIRAGLSGGKGIPETVATHPCVFTTLTAPRSVRSTSTVRRTADSCRAVPADAA
jgi:replication initiator protein RepSA